jgi:hypothetical protein
MESVARRYRMDGAHAIDRQSRGRSIALRSRVSGTGHQTNHLKSMNSFVIARVRMVGPLFHPGTVAA